MLSSPPSVSVNTGQYLQLHDQSEYQQPIYSYKLMSRVSYPIPPLAIPVTN